MKTTAGDLTCKKWPHKLKTSTQPLCLTHGPVTGSGSLRVLLLIILLLVLSAVWSSRPAFSDGREKNCSLTGPIGSLTIDLLCPQFVINLYKKYCNDRPFGCFLRIRRASFEMSHKSHKWKSHKKFQYFRESHESHKSHSNINFQFFENHMNHTNHMNHRAMKISNFMKIT